MKNINLLTLFVLSSFVGASAHIDMKRLGTGPQNKGNKNGETIFHKLADKCDKLSLQEMTNRVMNVYFKNGGNIPNPFKEDDWDKTAYENALKEDDCQKYRDIMLALIEIGYSQGSKDTEEYLKNKSVE